MNNTNELLNNLALFFIVGCYACRNPKSDSVKAVLSEKEAKEISGASYNSVSSNDVNLDLEEQTSVISNKSENAEESKLKKYKWSIAISILVLILIITLSVTLSDNEKSSNSNGATDDDLDRGNSNNAPEPSFSPTPFPTYQPTHQPTPALLRA